ncbi:hypothetical protein DPMN_194130 [Dreissena polymorpha]|uniref:Cadherin domain-containing protein n=1 Tax=Dreissena polymorpha TaxID=45954 RepID=A0A9D3Y2E3_DREPO|nr:hypothetical protein DPMN_194130 [Dreissena polymorpha]
MTSADRGPFAVTVWVIYSVSEAVAGRSLSYDTNPSYNLHIQCSDAAGVKGAEKIFTVHINDNKAPTIDNLSRSPITKLSLVAKDFSATDTVFTATGSDVENDNVIYDGDIVTNADLHSYPNNSFQLSVVATDKYSKNPTPYTVIVEITGQYIETTG